jgi:hypothetical protein
VRLLRSILTFCMSKQAMETMELASAPAPNQPATPVIAQGKRA